MTRNPDLRGNITKILQVLLYVQYELVYPIRVLNSEEPWKKIWDLSEGLLNPSTVRDLMLDQFGNIILVIPRMPQHKFKEGNYVRRMFYRKSDSSAFFPRDDFEDDDFEHIYQITKIYDNGMLELKSVKDGSERFGRPEDFELVLAI